MPGQKNSQEGCLLLAQSIALHLKRNTNCSEAVYIKPYKRYVHGHALFLGAEELHLEGNLLNQKKFMECTCIAQRRICTAGVVSAASNIILLACLVLCSSPEICLTFFLFPAGFHKHPAVPRHRPAVHQPDAADHQQATQRTQARVKSVGHPR